MTKLNQINALVTGRKGEAEKVVGDIYKIVQKPELFTGLARTFRAYDAENGEKLPPESKKVQHTVQELVETAQAKWTELWDLTFTQDAGNQRAAASITVDGKVVLPDVPVTSLLFLEKQVNDVETFVGKLPTPAADEDWVLDPNQNLLRSKPAETVRTKKEPQVLVKYEATKEHPAQTEVYHKDIPTGVWTNVSFSGAMPANTKAAILVRLKKLKDAIKLAREQANMIEVTPIKAGEPLFGFIFG